MEASMFSSVTYGNGRLVEADTGAKQLSDRGVNVSAIDVNRVGGGPVLPASLTAEGKAITTEGSVRIRVFGRTLHDVH